MPKRSRINSVIVLALISLGLCSLSCAEDKDTAQTGYEAKREAMVDTLVARWELSDERVIAAMRKTPRHLFVPERSRHLAYEDYPLPIGHEQTISAPSIVALMTQLLEPKTEHTVFEVGTGSGYQAAVLGELVKHVYSIEIVEPLANEARERLRRLGYENVSVRAGDGYRGWPSEAPFDGIIVTCAPERIPEPLIEQLKEGGRMVIPVGEERGRQELLLLKKVKGEIVKQSVLPVIFVPMTGEVQEK
jgi:protein-L-isoaspartate(D-aspartate) O-methyltransferase